MIIFTCEILGVGWVLSQFKGRNSYIYDTSCIIKINDEGYS